MTDKIRDALARVSLWTWLASIVFIIGSGLRLEHALTFDHVGRASDYNVHLLGVRWMQEYWRPFNLSGSVNYQVRSYPPLWYFLSASILEFTNNERVLVTLSLGGWVLRHLVLWRILDELLPRSPLSRFAGLTIHAILPLGVLIDGKVNPEAMHSGIFALAVYALFRIEQQARTRDTVSVLTGILFGFFAGVALLAKITGALLVVLGPVVIGYQVLCAVRQRGPRFAWQKFAAPAAAAALTWWLVAGWWVARNYSALGHPFPHVWDLEGPDVNAILADPITYRRPLGWALPFVWREYFEFPILRTLTEPRPNFWATEVVGTWSDIYNRGFCRLEGGPVTDKVWGGLGGFLSQGSEVWSVNQRCVDWFSTMAKVGVYVTAASVVALVYAIGRHLLSWGTRSSLILATIPLLCTFSGMRFALAYPYDNMAALNPRYLLTQAMPMSVCLSLALAVLEERQRSPSTAGVLSRLLLWSVISAIGVIGVMLIYERFGI